MIEFSFINVEVPGFDSELFVLWLTKTVQSESFKCGDITVVFCDDEYLLAINRSYLNHDYYTDIITFDYCENGLVNGDLFVSVDRVKENAESLALVFEDELRRVCVHGVLHLCGYKDKTDDEKKEMTFKEDFYLGRYVSRET